MVAPSTQFQLSLSSPDFSGHPVTDLFQCLGPESVFSAKHSWSQPRTVHLCGEGADYGLSWQGNSPVVARADVAGIMEGDYLVRIGDQDVKWDTREEVITKIRNTENYISITVVTPTKDWQKYKTEKSEFDCSLSLISSSSSVATLFLSLSSRTSFSSLSSTTSDESEKSGRKRSAWSVLRKS